MEKMINDVNGEMFDCHQAAFILADPANPVTSCPHVQRAGRRAQRWTNRTGFPLFKLFAIPASRDCTGTYRSIVVAHILDYACESNSAREATFRTKIETCFNIEYLVRDCALRLSCELDGTVAECLEKRGPHKLWNSRQVCARYISDMFLANIVYVVLLPIATLPRFRSWFSASMSKRSLSGFTLPKSSSNSFQFANTTASFMVSVEKEDTRGRERRLNLNGVMVMMKKCCYMEHQLQVSNSFSRSKARRKLRGFYTKGHSLTFVFDFVCPHVSHKRCSIF